MRRCRQGSLGYDPVPTRESGILPSTYYQCALTRWGDLAWADKMGWNSDAHEAGGLVAVPLENRRACALRRGLCISRLFARMACQYIGSLNSLVSFVLRSFICMVVQFIESLAVNNARTGGALMKGMCAFWMTTCACRLQQNQVVELQRADFCPALLKRVH